MTVRLLLSGIGLIGFGMTLRKRNPNKGWWLFIVLGALSSLAGALKAYGEALFSVERKTVQDLVNCCEAERERFERELVRLQGFQFRRLFIIGSRADVEGQRYPGSIPPASVLGSLATWETRHGLPVCSFPDPASVAAQVESWAFYFVREVLKNTPAILKGGVAVASF